MNRINIQLSVIRAHLLLISKKHLFSPRKIIAEGQTDNDGRVKNLVADSVTISPGIYKLVFDTKSYFQEQKIKGFYPSVNIEFEITDDAHYHVPLLLNPFGYSTYRGS